jgi:hypothetical protein
MSRQTEQKVTTNYGKDTRSFNQGSSSGTRSSTSSRNGSSESLRDLTSESQSATREISRANVAMQVTFSIPILSKAPVNPNSSC